ncbi:hypothetical protein C8T65DRAFT_726534 [Cerioporus squamosus]|nr:hypothetical protein C8T65DRAFT_726534 [Cerioporus squamosus]
MAQQRITVDTVSTAIFNLAIGGNHAGAVSRFSDLNSLLALVAAHPSNVTFLSLKLDVTQLPYVLHLLYNALNAPADNLEHLAIQVANSSEVNPPPIQLLRGRFPSLRFLSLDGLHIHHSSDVVPRLRVLKLWNHPAPPSALHPDELMAILRDAKSLKTLDIHRFLSVFAFQDDGPIRAPLQLPLLESFTCTDDIHSIRLFLQEVDIGPNVRTEFTAILPSDYAADLLTMYGPVSSVITLPGEWIEARARALAKLNPGEVPVDYPPVGYHLMSSALCTICADLVIQRDVRLQTLEIAAELDFINPVNWYQLFHATPHLTTLRLHDTARGRFGEASHGAHDGAACRGVAQPA